MKPNMLYIGALLFVIGMLFGNNHGEKSMHQELELLRGAHTKEVLEFDAHMQLSHELTLDEIVEMLSRPKLLPSWRARAIMRETMTVNEYVAYMRKRGK